MKFKLNKIIFGTIVLIAPTILTTISCSNGDKQEKQFTQTQKKQTKDLSSQFEQKDSSEENVKDLTQFVQQIMNKKLDLTKYTEKTASEIKYLNYLLNQSENNYKIVQGKQSLNLLVYVSFLTNKGDQEKLGRIVKIPHGDHFHEHFVTWEEKAPSSKYEQELYKSQMKGFKNYTYSFPLNEDNKIIYENVLVKNNAFDSYLVTKEQVIDFSEKDQLEKDFEPDTRYFDKKSYYFSDLVLKRFSLRKEHILKTLIENSSEKLTNPDEPDWTQLVFKNESVNNKNFLDFLLESLIQKENNKPGSTFLDKKYMDRRQGSKDSALENFNNRNWFIHKRELNLLEDILDTIIEQGFYKNFGFSKLEIDENLYNWFIDNLLEANNPDYSKISTHGVEQGYELGSYFQTKQAKLMNGEIPISNLEVVLQKLTKANNSDQDFQNFINSLENENEKTFFEKLKFFLPRKKNVKTSHKIYFFEDNKQTKHYFWDKIYCLPGMHYRRVNDYLDLSSGKRERYLYTTNIFRLFRNNRDLLYVPQSKVYGYEKKVQDESGKDTIVTVEKSIAEVYGKKDVNMGYILSPLNFFNEEDEDENLWYLSEDEKIFKTLEDRNKWVEQDNIKEWD